MVIWEWKTSSESRKLVISRIQTVEDLNEILGLPREAFGITTARVELGEHSFGNSPNLRWGA
jgi:hypothetical protein